MKFHSLFLVFLVLVSSALGAAPSKYKLKGSLRLSTSTSEDGKAPGAMTAKERNSLSVVLNAGAYTAKVRADGSFVFHDIPTGSYVMEVVGSMNFVFNRVRVDISSNKVRVSLASDYRQQLPYPVVLVPMSRVNPFEQREGLSMNTLYNNWTTLLLVGSMACMFICPKLLNVDPEEMKKMQEQMAKDQGEALGGITSLLSGGKKNDGSDDD